MGVQACRLPCFILQPTGHPKATHQWLLMGVQACRLPALKRLKPLKPLKTLKRLKTLTTRHGGPSLPFAMLHPAANRHPKATHQWLLMSVQACRLPALKRLKPLKTLKRLKTLTTRHGGPSLPFAMLHPAANRHPKATHQWLLMGVQACRLPALKRLKPLKTLISVSVYWMLFWCILLVRLFLAKTTSYAREARHTIPKIWKQHSMNSHGIPWYQYIRFIVPQSMFTLPRPSKTL